MNELLHCYTESANCSLYKEASEPERYPWSEGPRYRYPFIVNNISGLEPEPGTILITRSVWKFYRSSFLVPVSQDPRGEKNLRKKLKKYKEIGSKYFQFIFKKVIKFGSAP